MKFRDKFLCYFAIFGMFLFFPCLFQSFLIYASAEQLTLTIPTSSWHGANISSSFSRSVDTPVPPDGYVLAGVSASDYWQYTNCIAYYVPNNNTSWLCRGDVNSSGTLTSLAYFSAPSGSIMYSLRRKSDGTWDNITSSISNYNVGGFGAIWCKLPLIVSNGSTIEPSSIYPDDLFSMRSISSSEKQSLLEVTYNGTSTDSYSVGFYAVTADDYSSWWGSATADLASQSFSDLPSLNDDGSLNWYQKFTEIYDDTKTNLRIILGRETRITPTNNTLSRKKSIQTLPSPRVVVGYDNVSQILPAQAVVNWQDWINNSDMGGVYASTNIVIVARVSYTHTDPLTGNTLTDYYFCSQQFDISSIFSSAFTPDKMNTPTQPYIAPSDTFDLDKLATYLRYLHVNDNSNDTIRYNNFIQKLDDSAPLYVLQGLNGWLPNLSGELDSLFSSLFDDLNIDFSVPSEDQINSLKSDIDLKEEAFRQKFYWVSQIQTEVHFVTSTVISAGDTPVVVAVDANYDSPSADRHVSFGHLVLFDATKINPSIVEKAKDIITVFLSLGLLWYIFRTLPSTIGNTPNE